MAAESKYTEAVGRRKTSTARARITPSKTQSVVVNEKSLEEYFPTDTLRNTAIAPFALDDVADTFAVSVRVHGGGIASQAGAVRHAISRALLKHNGTLRSTLKLPGFLTRDSRMKERRKFGLKKARRAPQWSKR
jgi:small subunit ribosomal protein S9